MWKREDVNEIVGEQQAPPFDSDSPISGPYAGLDPEQQPVIVDPQGQRVTGETAADAAWTDAENAALVNALEELCATQTLLIECASDRPLHRLVIGANDFRASLAAALSAALKHHASK